jgi:hydroxymethylbilane synthase
MQELCRLHQGLEVEELHVVTTGDRIVDRALREVGGKGLFVKEIEEAILSGRAAAAVHSMKDVPAELADGLELCAIPLRADPRDVVVTRDGRRLAELPPGARVGTSSLRRSVQLAAFRPDLIFVPLRGNVDTRLRKCEAGAVDAIVLARAGLLRLGLEHRVTEVLDPEVCLPAGGQGALAVEHASRDSETRALFAPLSDPETAIAVSAERGLLAAVEGNCDTPVAAYAERVEGELWLRGLLAEPDGSNLRRREVRTPWPGNAEAAFETGRDLGVALRGGPSA